MKSRTLSDIKPMKPKKCEFDSINCTPDTIWKEWEQTCEELKRYKKTLERIGLTTDQKLLYKADYNRRIRAAQKAAVNP